MTETTCPYVDPPRYFEVNGKELIVGQDSNIDQGATVWDSALVLAKYLEKLGGETWKSQRVCELGAGCGLVGLSAAALGAEEVVLTDLLPLVHLLRSNINRNKSHFENCRIRAEVHRWGEETVTIGDSFDYILASDIAYDREYFEAFADSLKALSGPKTTIYICAELRIPMDARRFIAKVGESFSVDRIPTNDLDEDYRSDDIAVFRLSPKACSEE